MTVQRNKAWAIDYGPAGGVGKRITLDFELTVTARAGAPATAALQIDNPTFELIDSLYSRDTIVRVAAGFVDGGPVEIVAGRVVPDSVRTAEGRPSRPVRLQLSAARVGSVSPVLSITFRAARASDLIEAIRGALGIPAEIVDLPEDRVFGRYALQGRALPLLQTIVADCGAQYAIVDGRLRVWPLDRPARITADVWSPATGLLEVAAPAGDRRVRASAFLRPSLRPGDRIEIRGPDWSGLVRVTDLGHSLSSTGDAWDTEIVGVADA